MKLEMSEKDRKLLVFLSIFVIVVCFGYWGIYPAIKGTREIEKDIEKETKTQTLYDLKIAQLIDVKDQNDKLEEQIKTAKANYYGMMSSAEIDKYFTEMILSRNLKSYDLSIDLPNNENDTTKLSPYQYSEKAIEEKNAKKDKSADKKEKNKGVTGIYTATVSLKLGGDEEKIKKFINDISAMDDMMRICNFTWSGEKKIEETEDGAYTVDVEKVLTMTVELYMCEE